MATDYRLQHGMSRKERVLWYLGWNPRACGLLIFSLAGLGWVLARNPLGIVLGLLGLWVYRDAVHLINERSSQHRDQAEAFVKSEGLKRLDINSNEGQCYVLTGGSGGSPFGVKTPSLLHLTTAILCDTFIAMYPEARFRFADLFIQLPEGGEEIYYRYVSSVVYTPPVLEIHLSNKQTKRFTIAGDQSAALLSDLRARLRGVPPLLESNSDPRISATADETNEQPRADTVQALGEAAGKGSSPTAPTEASADVTEPRFCYLRLSKLQQLYQDPNVLDTLIEQLGVPGKASVLRQLTAQEKQGAIEAQIDHFRKSPTSVWYDVPRLEVLAASIWRAGEERDLPLTRKMVREHFCAVGREDDLRHPVAKWLKGRGYEPYMEVPLGRRRIDLLGFRKSGVVGSDSLLGIELKNDDAEFSRAIDQLGTFAEYAHAVYVACTPAFAAYYLDRNTESRGVSHWDLGVMDRKLTAGGYGLLIVERDTVFEVIKPVERTPSRDRVADALRSLSGVMRVEC